MSKIKEESNWLTEFAEFSNVATGEVNVPNSSFFQIKKRIFPNPWLVFGKVSLIHALVGFVSLLFCNQFGLNPFQTNQSLTNWFMKIAGHNLCMLLCGTFFMSTTYILANLFLKLEEFESIKRHEWLQTSFIGILSLAAFYFFGAELVGTFVGLWIVGALIGGYLSVEGSYRIRRRLAWKE